MRRNLLGFAAQHGHSGGIVAARQGLAANSTVLKCYPAKMRKNQ
jgi:hypothetical protein